MIVNVTERQDDLRCDISRRQRRFNYPENGTDSGRERSAASDQDGDAIVWTLTGHDREDFTITNGVLAFKSSPNFESAADEDTNNVYEVTVNASAGTLDVTVTVTNVDESGTVSLDKPSRRPGGLSRPPLRTRMGA